jgi:hypothetical protein
MSEEELLSEIDNHIEFLETTQRDSVECISIENLLSILKRIKIIY